MKHHNHNVGNEGAKHREHTRPGSSSWKPHRDWRVWIAALLIALILAYVLMDSLALRPGQPESQPMPETNAP